MTLAQGQSKTALVLRLTRAGVITGKVLDELGDPVENGLVSALRYQYVSGERRLTAVRSANTDDQGHYRLFGLEPSRYYLRVTSAASVPVVGSLTYPPVYYSGTTDESAASQIELAAGNQLSGVDFALVRSRAYRIIAEVQGAAGIDSRIVAMIRPRNGPVMPGSSRSVTLARKATRIDMQGITPGSYVLMAGTTEQGKPFIGSVDFEVVDRDLTNLAVPLQTGYEIAGTVRAEESANIVLANLRVAIRGAFTYGIGVAGGPSVTFGTRSEASVGEDGKFTLSGVFSDASRLTVTGLAESFYVQSIQMGDSEVLESGLDLSSGPRGAIRITLSGKAGAVSGSVTDADEKPVDGATVVLVPKSEKRRAGTQFYRSATTDPKGQFTIKGADPGEYTAYAWEDVETQAWMDKEFMKPVESKGLAVTVDPSGQHRVQLKTLPAGT